MLIKEFLDDTVDDINEKDFIDLKKSNKWFDKI